MSSSEGFDRTPFQGRITSNLEDLTMAFSAPGRRRRFLPQFISLETRSLLTAVVTCLGQDGMDLVGPDASRALTGFRISICNYPDSARAVSRSWSRHRRF